MASAKIGANRSGSAEALGIIDRRSIGQRGHRSDAGHRHETSADRIDTNCPKNDPMQLSQALTQALCIRRSGSNTNCSTLSAPISSRTRPRTEHVSTAPILSPNDEASPGSPVRCQSQHAPRPSALPSASANAGQSLTSDEPPLNQPVRTICAMPCASFRSVFTVIALSAALTCRSRGRRRESPRRRGSRRSTPMSRLPPGRPGQVHSSIEREQFVRLRALPGPSLARAVHQPH